MEAKKNKIGSFLRAAIRGVVKSLPFGNVVMEVTDNIKANVTNEIESTTEGLASAPANVSAPAKPHHTVSILVQLICIAAIIYAFATKQIDLKTLIEILGF